MEKKVSVKRNAVELLEKQLKNRAKKEAFGYIVMGSSTDAYLHFEEEYQLTRQLLQVILKYKFPVHIITKSSLVLRDLDLLHEIGEHAILPENLKGKLKHKTIITFSFSTTDAKIGKIFEPGAPAPSERLEALKFCTKNNFTTGVSLMPLLPFISDRGEHLVEMFEAFKAVGANYILPATITLFGLGKADSKTLVFEAVKKHYPDLLEKYHQFFGNSHEMPPYYRDAFYKKMQELSLEYDLPLRIIP